MTDWLTKAGYSYVESDAVWCRENFNGIAYSDGDEFEGRMIRLLEDTQDRSLFSSQLAAACIDWPSYYHLSSTRSNILRPFEERLKGAAVLEVGAGCGAITRFLGESGANVCALEGSRRRARIARLRTADLQNVTVVSDNFESFTTERKFDVVTFIGVIEYANQFVKGENPAAIMLERARSMLRPGGVVVIAIENQLGLKYFAGAPEDHVARRMFGLENRYSSDGVRTYGRDDFTRLIKGAGLSGVRFYAPFPDYKFPATIVSEEGMTDGELDVVSMVRGSLFADRQLTNFLSFDLPRVWEVVVKNKLGMDLANSFLVIASGEELPSSSALAWHYSTGRAARFCKTLSFERAPDGDIQVSPRLVLASSDAALDAELSIKLPTYMPYVRGIPLSNELTALLTTDGWSVEEVAASVNRFLRIAEELMKHEGFSVSLSSAEVEVPGQYIDLIPQNILRAESGEFHLIDREWVYHAPVTVSWLVFRAFSALFFSLPVFGFSRSEFNGTRLGFMVAVFNALGLSGTEESIRKLGEMEARLQSLVVGREVPADCWGPQARLSRGPEECTLPIHSFQEMVQRYESMASSLADPESSVGGARREVAVLRDQMQREEAYWKARLSHLYEEIRKVEGSLSWRITRPLRGMKALFSRR
jgi:SAM-dependent methyltransferase